MDLELSDDLERVSWDELVRIFELAPLGTREPVNLEKAFRSSPYRCFVYDEDILVGAGRAISDQATYAVIFDVVVLPQYQGQGVGSRIMRDIIQRAEGEVSRFMLYAVPGKEAFYEKLGFRRMTTAMALFPNPEKRAELGYIV